MACKVRGGKVVPVTSAPPRGLPVRVMHGLSLLVVVCGGNHRDWMKYLIGTAFVALEMVDVTVMRSTV